jgi:hypothetical protein
MKGILRLAFKLLVNDSAKFTALIVVQSLQSARSRRATGDAVRH